MVTDSFTWGHLVTVASSLIAVAGVVYGVRANRRTSDAANHREDFKVLLTEQRETFESLLQPMREEIAALTTKVATLEALVVAKDALLEAKDRTIRAATGFIRELLTWASTHVPHLTPPGVPEPLADEVDPRRVT